MKIFVKTTVGFVTQVFEKNASGKFICVIQNFTAEDNVQFENAVGEPIQAPDYEYHPYNMTM